MRIAIVGGGISGLVAAHRLSPRHEITLFEAADYLGGHTHTIAVDAEGRDLQLDTGFIVFNERTYPQFCALLDKLGVDSQPTTMSFSVRCDASGLEYNGTSLSGLFAQRRNLLRPSFLRMLADVMRFNRAARALAEAPDEGLTVDAFLAQGGYSRAFARHYLLPMGSAIWSCPPGRFGQFPLQFVAEFYRHHGLLDLRDRPIWRTVCGGARRYVEALAGGFRDRIRLRTPVQRVSRDADGVELQFADGRARFDHVVLACHADQALRLLADATPLERSLLAAFPYERNTAVLHTDASLLPKSRRAWAAWNYRLPAADAPRACVTYNLNLLQRLSAAETYCVSLNQDDEIDPAKVLRRMVYDHPVFTLQRRQAQSRHGELIGSNHTSYCGAYWGNGFHEDGVASAMAVCRELDALASVRQPTMSLSQ